eukprot:10483969-Prorocentrum_lima.AAC.1
MATSREAKQAGCNLDFFFVMFAASWTWFPAGGEEHSYPSLGKTTAGNNASGFDQFAASPLCSIPSATGRTLWATWKKTGIQPRSLL